jgi:hypothetical protein
MRGVKIVWAGVEECQTGAVVQLGKIHHGNTETTEKK